MKYLVCFAVAIFPLIAGEFLPNRTCTRTFKCIDNTKFQICLKNQPVKWEFSCPNSTYCSETSNEICASLSESTTKKSNEHLTEKIHITNESDLSCKDEGKYAIPNNNCTHYRLCTSTINGIQSREFKCPIGFSFDPALKVCSNSYVCPELENLTTKIDDTNAEEPKPTIDDAPLIPDTTDSSSPSSTCKEEGKITVPNTECKIFLLCILTSTGFRETKYTCPTGFQFDPYKEKCTNMYVCPELTTTSTTEFTTPVEVAREVTSPRVVSSTTLESTTKDLDIIMCETTGNISIPETNCTKYLQCSETIHGFITSELICPHGFLYDPDMQQCSNTYECVDWAMTSMMSTVKTVITSTTTAIPTTNKPEPSSSEKPNCIEEGKFTVSNSNCTKYQICTLTSIGLHSEIFKCPSQYYYNPDFSTCTDSYVCPDLITASSMHSSTEAINIVTQDEETVDMEETITTDYSEEEITTNSSTPNTLSTTNSPFTCATTDGPILPKCIQEGRFPIIGSKCRQYILCTQTVHGYKMKSYQCPKNADFNPDTRRCIFQYQCTEVLKSCGTTYKSPTTEPSTTTFSPESNIQFPDCKVQGKLPISNTDCKNYLLCMQSSTGFISAMYSCTNGTLFDPKLESCSNSYECIETKNRIKRNISQGCSTVGPFGDPTDSGCQYFYSCVESTDGPIKYIKEKCKDGLYFDPEMQKCSKGYDCEKNRFRFLTRHSMTTLASSRMLANGQCTTVGRYLVPGTNCKNYVLCRSGPNGLLTQTNFFCPTTTVFNQVIQQCTNAYTCPDSICLTPGWVPNPNVKDCSSYIECTPNFNVAGMLTSFTGGVQYCQTGTYYNPFTMFCDPTYVCST